MTRRRRRTRRSAPDDIERIRAQTLTGDRAACRRTRRGSRSALLPAVLYGAEPSLWRPGGRRSEGDRQVHARRPRSASQQRWLRPDNVKIFIVSDRPLTRGPAAARSAVRQLDRARAWRRASKTFAAPPPRPASAEDPARQPARLAAVEHPRRRAAADRSAGPTSSRSTPPTTCSAAPSCRGSTWTCARTRAGPTASAATRS